MRYGPDIHNCRVSQVSYKRGSTVATVENYGILWLGQVCLNRHWDGSKVCLHECLPLYTHAGASKGGLDLLTKVMGLELGPHKVCLIIILPLPEWYDIPTDVHMAM